jgi:hypothetical protein
LPRPFHCTPGRLSRGYHSQEEGLEINLRGYRPTIFVLHRGRWGTGEFRRQPFSDLEFSCKRILRFRRRQSSAKRLLRILFLQLLHKIHNSGLTSAHGQSREHRFWTAVSGEWTCQEQARKGIRARRRDIDRYAEQICYPQHAPPGSRASPSRSRFSSAARRIVLRQLYHWWRHADHPGQLSRRAQGGHYDAHWLRARPAVLDHEVSDFTQDRGTVPFRPQGDVGATIMMVLDCRNLYCERRAFRLVWTAASVIPEPLGTAPGSIASRGCY